MCYPHERHTQLLFEWMNLSVTYSLTNIKKELESRRRDWNRTSIIVQESVYSSEYFALPIAHSPLWLYNMTNTKQSLRLLFSAPLKTFCGAVVLHAQRAAHCVPFRFACAGNSCPARFILSAFTAFATSGDALAGLSLLSILGRRSWIVSLAPSYMLFFCVSIFQRTSFCGRKRCDPQELSESRA